MIKGVIFDFNGTLFWDTEYHNKAWDIFLDSHQLRLSDDQKSKEIHGKNNAEILCNLFHRKLSAIEIKKLSIQKENIYQQLCLDQKMELAPGAIEFIEFLIDKQILFTIATASDLYNLNFYFEQFGLEKYFDKSLIVYSNGNIKSKPNPEIFLKAMSNLGLKPSEVLIFEDSHSGIKAAENSKVKKIIIVNSNEDNYSGLNYDQIKDFGDVDKKIFA